MKFALHKRLFPFTLSPNGHLLAAALIWSLVGIVLIIKAVVRFPTGLYPQSLLTLSIFCTGTLKSLLVLDRTALKNIARIEGFTRPRTITALYPPALWILIAAMIAAGITLKYLPLPTILLSFIYGTVGWALLFSSRCFWSVWQQRLKEKREQ